MSTSPDFGAVLHREACPACGAQPGQPCVGLAENSSHFERGLGPERVEHYARIFGPDAPPVREVDLGEIGAPVIALACAGCGAAAGEPCRGTDAGVSHGRRALTEEHLEQVDLWLELAAGFDTAGARAPLATADPGLRYVSEPASPFAVRFDREANVMEVNVSRFLYRVYLGGTPKQRVLDHACGCLIAAARTPAPAGMENDADLLDVHLASVAHVGASSVVKAYEYEQEESARQRTSPTLG